MDIPMLSCHTEVVGSTKAKRATAPLKGYI